MVKGTSIEEKRQDYAQKVMGLFMERNGIFPTPELDSSKVQPMYTLQLHAWTQKYYCSFIFQNSINNLGFYTLIDHPHLQNPKSRKDTSNCNVILFSKEATNSDQVIYSLSIVDQTPCNSNGTE